MSDLRWTLPIAAWASTTTATPKLDFIDPMVRRRLSTLSKMALWVAHECARDHAQIRLVFASRHGELARTTAILRDIEAREPVSPNAFSLSVLNAMSGIYGIARRDRSPATAVAAGTETLGYALLEAYAQWMEDPSVPVLVVYADEPADTVYGNVENEVAQGALAVLLDAPQHTRGHLHCVKSADPDRTDDPLDPRDASVPTDVVCVTQREAVLRCLESGLPNAWHSANARWQWQWESERGQHEATA